MIHTLVPWRRTQPERYARLDLYDELDRVFENFLQGFGLPASGAVAAAAAPRVFAPRMDVSESESAYRVDAELPGLEEKDISVTLENGVLSIAGERKQEQESQDEKRGFHHKESFRGSFQRSLRLPDEIDEKGISASYKNGVLSIVIPKLPKARPETRTIPVSSS
jgi:HSP20 family protein